MAHSCHLGVTLSSLFESHSGDLWGMEGAMDPETTKADASKPEKTPEAAKREPETTRQETPLRKSLIIR